MKVENIASSPIKASYKAGAYASMAVVSIALTAFILWSLSSMGGALIDMLTKS